MSFDWHLRQWGDVPINDVWGGVINTGTTYTTYAYSAREDGSVAGQHRPGGFAETPVTAIALAAVWGDATSGRIWVIDVNGRMYESMFNSSAVWQVGPAIPTNGTVSSMTGSEDGKLWAVGSGGLVAHFDGQSWTTETHGSGVLDGVWALGDEVWVVGQAGAARRSGGGTWQDLAPTTGALHDVFGLASNELWVVGDGGAWFHWDGTEWHEIATPTESALRAVWADSEAGVWAGGDDGTFLHLSHGSAVAVPALEPSYTDGLNITALHGVRAPQARSQLQAWAATAEGTVLTGVETIAHICE